MADRYAADPPDGEAPGIEVDIDDADLHFYKHILKGKWTLVGITRNQHRMDFYIGGVETRKFIVYIFVSLKESLGLPFIVLSLDEHPVGVQTKFHLKNIQ